MNLTKRKRVFINASTVKISGGLYITLDIISVLTNNSDVIIKIVCPDIGPFRKFKEKAEIQYVPRYFFYYFFRPLLDYWWLNKQIKLFQADLVVSLSNLPARVKCKQVFFHDNAFMSIHDLRKLHLSPKLKLINSIRRFIFKNRIKFIDRLIVQTKLENKRMIERYGSKLPVVVLSPMLLSHLTINIDFKLFEETRKNNILIGCLSRYFEHKNLEILIDAAKLCDEQNLPYRFIITIDKNQGWGARRMIHKIYKSNFSGRITNIGKVRRKNVSAFVSSVDALILPSLLETYGLNCIESWYHEKPLFIADRDYSREVCENAALYFRSFDARSIIRILNEYFNENKSEFNIISAGKEKILHLSQPDDIINEILSCCSK